MRPASAPPWTACSAATCRPTTAATSKPSPARPESPGPASTRAPAPTATSAQGAYRHLAEEVQRRLAALREAGTIPDPRELQITRLKTENATLRERIQTRDEQITELTEFKERALSRRAAQHQEILRLRHTRTAPDNVRALTTRSTARTTGPCS
jgi:hypothetical protein